MHTAIGSLRLRSRGAHCDRILAVEVQGCTLRSDPGMHTAIRSLPDKIGEADWRSRLAKNIGDEDWRGREEGRKEGRKEEEEQL